MIKKTTLILFSFIVQIGVSQNTYIPNNNFEQELINLGLDSGFPNDSVPTANIDTLSYLDVSFKSINDLTGIQDFTSLEVLKCYGNLLSNINVTQNQQLKELWCHYNQLSNLNIDSNYLLEVLVCSYNSLNQVDVTQNINLKILETIGNPIGNIDVSQNINLEELFCGNNQLTNLDVVNNPNLNILWCKGNQLTNLDVTQNQNLEYLLCSGNNFGSIDLSQNPILFSLICQNCQLTELDVSNNPMLVELFCDTNQIDSLYLGNNPALEKFHCRMNYPLQSLDLSSNSALYNFACNDNMLTSLNVKNGNNVNFFTFSALYNPLLYCIEVDDSTYSANNWLQKDAQCIYSENCSISLGTDRLETDNGFRVYPNPTTGNIYFKNLPVNSTFKLMDSLGKEIESFSGNINLLDIKDLPKGIYFIQLVSEKKASIQKVIKN